MPIIHFLSRPNPDVYLAFSGGVDSVVLLHTLIRRKYKVTLLTIDHNTEFSKVEVEFSKKTAADLGMSVEVFNIPTFDRSTSLEAFWSKHRNEVFQSMNKQVCTAHHLDDATEWYLMSTFQGTPKLLEHVNRNIIRPMLTTPKKSIYEYANAYNLKYLTDPTNLDPNNGLRNRVRLELMGSVKSVFPGISTTVRRLLVEKNNKNKLNRTVTE